MTKYVKPDNDGDIISREEKQMRKYLLSAVAAGAVLAGAGSAFADEAAAKKWIDQEFQPSVLSKDEQLAEMQWFIKAAEPFSGMEINVLSEGIPTHSYESEVLTKAFEEITRSSAKGKWCRPCRHRCRPAGTSMTPMSMTPT